MRPRDVVGLALVTGLLLSGCGGGDDDDNASETAAPATTSSSSPSSEPSATPAPEAVDPASVKANELASVPVMMYHQVKADPKGEYDQTPADFKAELERMWKAGFVPITTSQMVDGDIDIPAGKHPVVLTFDDSSPSQIQIGADGNPTADSAIGILEAFSAEHPDFPATASLYINDTAFNDEKAIPWLVENGYEVGVHTVTHANLKQLSSDGVQKEIANNVRDIKKAAPDAKITTMALPFGISPQDKSLEKSGSYEGNSYELKAALLVGSNPAKSPFNTDFDPYAIARIRSGPKDKPVDLDSTYWLDKLDKGDWTIYTSDGDPNKISYPSTSKVAIDSDYASKANKYDPSGSSSGSTDSSASPNPTSSSASSTEPEDSTTSSPEPSSTSTP
jgi:hypothetical protein